MVVKGSNLNENQLRTRCAILLSFFLQEKLTFPASKYHPRFSVSGKTLKKLTKILKEIMKHSFLTPGEKHVLIRHILFIH